MAGYVSAGIFFILILGTSYCYPTKKDGSDTNPGAGAAHGLTFSQPGVGRGPVSSFGPNAGAAPAYSGGAGRYPVGPVLPNAGPAATQDVEWLKEPPSPLSDVDSSQAAPGMGGGGTAAGGVGAGSSLSHSHDSEPAGPPVQYQPGELSHIQNTFEHGNYDTETESQGAAAPSPGGGSLPGPVILDAATGLALLNPDYYSVYPYYDFLFLTGQYPPGTVSHFSSNFEQGKDFWHDTHYNKYYLPRDSDGQQVKAVPPVKQQTGLWP
ncbi:uncharacterized protein LOC115402053 [Salarias fasciatus]|uniref:uncharacterized protein LOC115402053 n=1 Tax=Salarias fasciatus TaxID=181472 RepID=UPI001176D31C|nr:uncharacterized protein LOC115402053 [Salarias fasciatus]